MIDERRRTRHPNVKPVQFIRSFTAILDAIRDERSLQQTIEPIDDDEQTTTNLTNNTNTEPDITPGQGPPTLLNTASIKGIRVIRLIRGSSPFETRLEKIRIPPQHSRLFSEAFEWRN